MSALARLAVAFGILFDRRKANCRQAVLRERG
jgi:hypothetical protein